MSIIQKASDFAKQKHRSQKRKDGRPYFVHPEAVAKKVEDYKVSDHIDELIAAAYLHDTLEDTNTTYYELVEQFGFHIASLVLEVTSNKEMKEAIGKDKYLSYKLKHMTSWALVIKLCDRLDNVMDLDLDHLDNQFRSKYILETKYIIKYLEKNYQLTKTHQTIIGDIKKQLDYLIDKYMINGNSNAKEYLGKTVTIKMDRELGCKHPKHGFTYLLNYGYVPGTVSGDGEELDAYIVGEYHPVSEFTGTCIAVIHRTNDDDDKLVVAPKGKMYTTLQIKALTEFQEKWFESVIIK